MGGDIDYKHGAIWGTLTPKQVVNVNRVLGPSRAVLPNSGFSFAQLSEKRLELERALGCPGLFAERS